MNKTSAIRLFVVFTLLLSAAAAFGADAPELWNTVESAVRDDKISEAPAQAELTRLKPLLNKYFADKGGKIAAYVPAFPLQGYELKDADLKGYIDHGYDFFSIIRHKDHPAVDIFIYDRKHACLDDRTKKPVNIVSLSPGVVVGTYDAWQPGNVLRGGNTVWVYDPVTESLFYYAHMKTVIAKVGEIVKPGDILGHVGRTGVNAYAKRSPTHLHIMYLKYPDDGYPYPLNVGKLLKLAAKSAEIKPSKCAK